MFVGKLLTIEPPLPLWYSSISFNLNMQSLYFSDEIQVDLFEHHQGGISAQNLLGDDEEEDPSGQGHLNLDGTTTSEQATDE